jgi:hypothetical protein
MNLEETEMKLERLNEKNHQLGEENINLEIEIQKMMQQQQLDIESSDNAQRSLMKLSSLKLHSDDTMDNLKLLLEEKVIKKYFLKTIY